MRRIKAVSNDRARFNPVVEFDGVDLVCEVELESESDAMQAAESLLVEAQHQLAVKKLVAKLEAEEQLR